MTKLSRLRNLLKMEHRSLLRQSFTTTTIKTKPAPPPSASSSFHSIPTTTTPHPIVYSPLFTINPVGDGDGHRFPMPKDHALFTRLQSLDLATRTHLINPNQLPFPDDLCLAHTPTYVHSFLDGSITPQEMKKIGLQWSRPLVTRTLAGVGSAILAARLASMHGVAIMSNGGTHHAHPSHGSGWCIFNDLAIAARALQRDLSPGTDVEIYADTNTDATVPSKLKILFIDCDVHMGDGTAAIFANDPSVFTFSIHCKDQPFPNPATILHPSDYDTPLPAGTGDDGYLSALSTALPRVFDLASNGNGNGIDLVLYNAGVDVHKDDVLGLLNVTDAGIWRRERMVMEECVKRGVPIAAAIGGGYVGGGGDVEKLVDRHIILHRVASEYEERLRMCGTVMKRKRGR